MVHTQNFTDCLFHIQRHISTKIYRRLILRESFHFPQRWLERKENCHRQRRCTYLRDCSGHFNPMKSSEARLDQYHAHCELSYIKLKRHIALLDSPIYDECLTERARVSKKANQLARRPYRYRF